MAATTSGSDLSEGRSDWAPEEVRRGRIVFAILAVAAFGLLLALGFGMTFFADEWAFIGSRALGDPSTWWAPHNEHWVTMAILAYRVLVETVGIGSYVPYLVLLVALHVLVCAAAYGLLERTAGPLVAVGGGTILLLFGSGLENVYWAFQISFVGSVALGLLAMHVTDRDPTPGRALLVALLLLASLASSGVGLIMSVAIGTEWLVDRRWRRYLPYLVLPATAYLAWYLAFGRQGIVTFRDPLSGAALLDVLPSILRGLSNAFGGISGLPLLGFFVAAALATWGGRAAARGAINPRAVGAFVAIAVQYALIGAARGGLFDGAIDYTRYTYVSGVLAMIALGAMVGPVHLPGVGRGRTIAIAALGSWVALALVVNVGLLVAGRTIFLERADMTRALVTVALDPIPEGVDGTRSLVLVPSPDALRRIAAAYGDPRSDSLVPWAVRPIPDDVLVEARRRLIEGAPLPLVDE